jgi:hypothetical protein
MSLVVVIVVVDNVEVSKNEMPDYLKYVRNSSGIYRSETIKTILEFTPNVKDAIEVRVKVA